jgi:hypothetical protein
VGRQVPISLHPVTGRQLFNLGQTHHVPPLFCGAIWQASLKESLVFGYVLLPMEPGQSGSNPAGRIAGIWPADRDTDKPNQVECAGARTICARIGFKSVS